MLAILGPLVIAALAPIIIPIYYAKRQRLNRPIVFVLFVPGLYYGSLLYFYLAVIAPIQLYTTYAVPALHLNGYSWGAWFFAPFDQFISHYYVWGPWMQIAVLVLLTRKLAGYWNVIVRAIAHRHSER